MDPDVTLANIRELTALSNDRHLTITESFELAAAFDALDEWMSKGGFLPDAWNVHAGRAV